MWVQTKAGGKVNFTKVFMPRQAPCRETPRPAGWGSRGYTLFYTPDSRPACRPLQATPGHAAGPFSIPLYKRQSSGQPGSRAQHAFRKEGPTEAAAWGVPSSASLPPQPSTAGTPRGQPTSDGSARLQIQHNRLSCSQRYRLSPVTQVTEEYELQTTGW